MRRHPLRALAAACLLVLAAAPLLSAQIEKPDYGSLVARYAQGDRAEAVAALGFLSYSDAIQGYGELKAAAERASKRGDDAGSADQAEELARLQLLLRAAAMLHWDRDDADRPPAPGVEQPRPCPGKQSELAIRYATLLARWPETRRFAKLFFLTVSNSCQWDFCLDAALRSARDGLKSFPRDAELLLAAGSVLEEGATQAEVILRDGMPSMRQQERDYRQGALLAREQRFKEARREFEEALAVDPGLTLARIRLGRVLWRLGESEAAAGALERAIQEPPAPAFLSLARLFLGQVHEDAGRVDRAVDEYRRALELDPASQAAAVALSHGLRLAGDLEGSRRVLAESLAHAGRRSGAPLFWNYLTSNVLRFQDEFDALRRETLR